MEISIKSKYKPWDGIGQERLLSAIARQITQGKNITLNYSLLIE